LGSWWSDDLFAAASADKLYEKLEQVTGVHVELITAKSMLAAEQLKELKASGSMPDIIEWSWLRSYPGGPGKAIDDGLIVSLAELIPRHAPNLLRLLREDVEVARAICTADGRYYAFPDLRVDPAVRAQVGAFFRKDWLEKVKMDPPTTLDQWHEVLRAFKRASFGTASGVPPYPFFILAWVRWWAAPMSVPARLEIVGLSPSNGFAGAYGVAHGFYRRDERIRYGPAEPEYAEVLALLASWYAEGLIHPAIAEPDRGQDWIQVIASCGSWFASYDFVGWMKPLRYVPAPLPRRDSGSAFLGPTVSSPCVGRSAAAVSATSAHVTEAVRWLDVAYGEWGKRLFNFGIKGASYTIERGDPVLVDSVTSDLARGGAKGESTWEGLYRYSRGLFGGPFDVSAELYRQQVEALMPGGEATILGWKAGAQVDPLVAIEDDPDAREALEEMLGPLQDYSNRQVLRFISGQRALSELRTFVRELDERGLEHILEILNRADEAWRRKAVLVR